MAAKEQKIKYTKYEKARLIGSRALQISMGAEPLVKLTEKDLENLKYNPVEIAKMEFEEGIIPLKIKRPVPGSKREEKTEEKKEEKKAEA